MKRIRATITGTLRIVRTVFPLIVEDLNKSHVTDASLNIDGCTYHSI